MKLKNDIFKSFDVIGKFVVTIFCLKSDRNISDVETLPGVWSGEENGCKDKTVKSVCVQTEFGDVTDIVNEDSVTIDRDFKNDLESFNPSAVFIKVKPRASVSSEYSVSRIYYSFYIYFYINVMRL